MNGLFITGSDTEVGKTWICCAVIRTLRRTIARVGAYKPVASGALGLSDSDPYRLWEAIGRMQSESMVCPQAFAAPLAPPLAADMEGRFVDRRLLESGARDWNEYCDFLVVEGAGGLLSPLTFEMTNADLASQLGWPIVIVIANRLGAVNQSLMAFEAAQARKLVVAAIVLNETVKSQNTLTNNRHAEMVQRQLQVSQRIAPPIIECAFGQTEFFQDGRCLPLWITRIINDTDEMINH